MEKAILCSPGLPILSQFGCLISHCLNIQSRETIIAKAQHLRQDSEGTSKSTSSGLLTGRKMNFTWQPETLPNSPKVLLASLRPPWFCQYFPILHLSFRASSGW